MQCPKCSTRMFCKDSRWDSVKQHTRRRWVCQCGVRGTTLEKWEGKAEVPAPKVKKVFTPPAIHTAMARMVRPPKPEPKPKPKPQRVGGRSARDESLFDSMDEDYRVDLRELGIDGGYD